jgi:hypothetical protein
MRKINNKLKNDKKVKKQFIKKLERVKFFIKKIFEKYDRKDENIKFNHI